MNPVLLSVLLTVGGIVVALFGGALMVKKFYIKVSPGQALVNNKMGDTVTVSFTGGLVLPIVHRAETMDISVKAIEIDRRGKEGLTCKDNIRADIKVAFFVRVNPLQADVLKVAESIGCVRASHQETMDDLFNAKFSEALKTVGYQMNFVELYTERQQFKDRIVETIGKDLNGYKLEDVAIDYLEQTAVSSLDPENTLDAEGIRAITMITTNKNIETNRLRNEEQKQITKQNVEAKETILSLQRQQAEAEARQQREIAVVRSREMAETQKVAAEMHLVSSQASIAAEEEIAILGENKERQVQVAQKNRERVIGIETERVQKDRNLEAIMREREVELLRIDKEKQLEIQKKDICDVVRGRVAVERTVAEEEERIKDVRVHSEAKRQREVRLIAADTTAQEKMMKDVKEAEGAEKAAIHWGKQKLTLADAELEAADRESRAKMKKAEGLQAEVAAPGLAEVKVKEADANAVEKRGLVDARLMKEKLSAQAEGEEKQGLAKARVREADAAALEKTAHAQATMLEKTGMAEAVAIREKGHAEADATQQKMMAEAKGVAEKMIAMKAMEGAAREHEEYRLNLENQRLIQIEALHIQQKIAEHQSHVMGKAFENAKFDIVGGDGAFFDRFVNAISLGKSLDGFMAKSETGRTMMGDYTSGERSFAGDVRDVLARPALAGDMKDLSIAALLGRLASHAGTKEEKSKLAALITKAKELGLDAE